MRYAVYAKIHVSLLPRAEKFFKWEVDSLRAKMLKRSIRLFNPTLKFFEQDSDNFARNMVTARILFDGYKVPRITKPKPVPDTRRLIRFWKRRRSSLCFISESAPVDKTSFDNLKPNTL